MHQLAEEFHQLDLHSVVGEEVVSHLVMARLVAQHRLGDGVGQVRRLDELLAGVGARLGTDRVVVHEDSDQAFDPRLLFGGSEVLAGEQVIDLREHLGQPHHPRVAGCAGPGGGHRTQTDRFAAAEVEGVVTGASLFDVGELDGGKVDGLGTQASGESASEEAKEEGPLLTSPLRWS